MGCTAEKLLNHDLSRLRAHGKQPGFGVRARGHRVPSWAVGGPRPAAISACAVQRRPADHTKAILWAGDGQHGKDFSSWEHVPLFSQGKGGWGNSAFGGKLLPSEGERPRPGPAGTPGARGRAAAASVSATRGLLVWRLQSSNAWLCLVSNFLNLNNRFILNWWWIQGLQAWNTDLINALKWWGTRLE